MNSENQSERAARQRFLAELSHELRTPLNAVICLAQLLELENSAELPRQDLQRLQVYAWQLSAMIDQLLESLATGPCWGGDTVSISREQSILPTFDICRCAEWKRGHR